MVDSRIKSVSDLISQYFDKETTSKGSSYGNFRSAWRDLAGERLAGHSRPVDIRHGVLIVETEHQGWSQLLQYQQERILDEIGRKFPELEIRAIAWRLASSGLASESVHEPDPRRSPVQSPEPASGRAPGLAPKPALSESPPQKATVGTEGGPSGAGALPPELRAAFERLKRGSREK